MKKSLGGLLITGRIINAWGEIVGENFSKGTQPTRLIRGVLMVKVESSVLLNQLSYIKGEILKRLSDKIGKGVVKDVKFKIGRISDEYLKDMKSVKIT